MSDYVYYRDLLDDTYQDEEQLIPKKIWSNDLLYTLSSKLYPKPVSMSKIGKTKHTAVILTLLLLEEQFSQQVIERDENSRTYDSEKVYEVMHGLQAVNDYTRLMSINN